ncbi:hypothetical protein DFJ43DRAFT_1036851 [Lentinula guzmanii]|uniref:Uncharacterized protein n=1 Tax=Lentinula guzmanii TaxID=2804957 RepID=A0AA38N332_9AGAR|nr:hypothetical protein DFJ43DRAFT_1036851 [Lentinula guzmanii]
MGREDGYNGAEEEEDKDREDDDGGGLDDDAKNIQAYQMLDIRLYFQAQVTLNLENLYHGLREAAAAASFYPNCFHTEEQSTYEEEEEGKDNNAVADKLAEVQAEFWILAGWLIRHLFAERWPRYSSRMQEFPSLSKVRKRTNERLTTCCSSSACKKRNSLQTQVTTRYIRAPDKQRDHHSSVSSQRREIKVTAREQTYK